MATLPEKGMCTHSQRQNKSFESGLPVDGHLRSQKIHAHNLGFEIWFSDDPNYPTYANGVIMEYETDSVDALEKYAIVQFTKGCVFYSSKNGKSKINRNVSDTVPSFGEDIPFCFPKWVIDSQDTDPAYNSDPEYGRFYLLRWNKPAHMSIRTINTMGPKSPKSRLFTWPIIPLEPSSPVPA
jgi:hypothetical protein